MHRGCFVWTLTPPVAGRRTPRPGPVRVCVCSSVLAGSGGPASRARSGVTHLFFWPLCLSALLGPLRAGFAPVLVLCFPAVSSFALFSFFVSPLFFSLRPLCLLLSLVSGPGCPRPWLFVLFVLLALRFLALRALLLSLCCLAVGRSPVVAPPPPLSRCCCRSLLPCACFLFPLVCAPFFLAFCVFRHRVPRALALVGVCCVRLSVLCVVFFYSAPRFFLRSRLFCVPWLAAGCCPPPPPLLCLAVFVVFARCLGFFFSPLVRPRCLRLSLVSGPGCPGPWRCVLFVCLSLPLPGSPCALASFVSPAWLWAAPSWLLPPPPPPSPFVSPRFRRSCSVPWFFFSSSVRPRCLRLSLVTGPGCPWPGRCALIALLAFCFSALRALSPLSCFPPGHWLLPGGCCPPLCLAVFVAAARCCVPCAVPCCVSLGAVLRRAAARCAARCCALVCCVALLHPFGAAACCAMPSGAARRPGALCFAALCFAVFPRAVCSVLCVFCRGVVVRAVVCRSALCFVCPGVLCCAFCCPLHSVRCCASLCWCACVVLFVWCVLLLAPGAVVRCCVLCCFLWFAVVRCWVWWPVVVCWWRVSVSVSLSDRVVCFPVVGVVCCGALLPCAVCCGAVPSRGAVLLCSAVVLPCCWGLFCPPVACRAVLCCAVGWLCCFLPGGGVCVLWCPFPPCRHAQKTSIILHVTRRWWRCRGWLALVDAVS